MLQTPKSLRLHIALLGRVNAGKSSFLNLIAGQEVSIASDVAGTTTDVVEKAQELLARSPLPIAAIAESVGIEDPAYFCRVFKKATSMSPQNYRRTHSRDRTNETGGTEL